MKLTVTLHCDGFHTDCPDTLSVTVDAADPDMLAIRALLLDYGLRSGWRYTYAKTDVLEPTIPLHVHCPDCVTRDGRWMNHGAKTLHQHNLHVIFDGGL